MDGSCVPTTKDRWQGIQAGPQPDRTQRQQAFWTLVDQQAACLFRCPSRLAAKEQAIAWANRWRAHAPLAVQQFMIDLSNSLTFYDLPKELWKRARTNNPWNDSSARCGYAYARWAATTTTKP